MVKERFQYRYRADFGLLQNGFRYLFFFFCTLFLFACSDSSPKNAEIKFPQASSGSLEITYPLNDTLFPADIVAPTFVWREALNEAENWEILFRFKDTNSFLHFSALETNWRPSEADWSEIKKRSTADEAEVAIVGIDANGNTVSARTIQIRTSIDPVGDSIFYREVPLPFIEAVQDPSRIRWRYGSVDSVEQPPIVLENLPVCGNCHSFSGDGSVLGLDVDYGNDKGGYAVLPVSENMTLNDEKIITWSDYKKDDNEPTFGLLSQVSPDGRYVISTVKDQAVFVATPGIEFSQLFFPIKGILVVYDTVTGKFAALPGADDPAYVQSNPIWSPDGKSVVFARAKVYKKDSITDNRGILLSEHDVPEFINDNEPFKFDLYRVPFNDGLGGTPEPLEGASHNGKSNFFAKFSPDGKWIVFTQAENYMLLMPDSELFILPAEGGEARRLLANTSRMNSWHSFSSNGRWLVFSSKQNTPYTQLFLTHIDEQGNSTPPVVLDRFTGTYGAANIPEFVPLPADAIAQIKEQFLDAYSFLRAGIANERTGNYPAAIKAYEKGLEVEPNNIELLNSMGFALFQNGESEKAVAVLEKAIEIDPEHWKAHNNLALASVDIGELELAEAHYRESLAIEPKAEIYNDLGFVLEQQGLSFEAIDSYRKALALDPSSATSNYNLGTSLASNGEFEEAEVHFKAALEINPDSSKALTGLGIVMQQKGNINEAISHFENAIEANPSEISPYQQLGSIQVGKGDLAAAERTFRKLIENSPSAEAHQTLAQLLAQLGRDDEAREEMVKAQAIK